MNIAIARIYDLPNSANGFRILVDRLWPRGISKERAGLDLWAKDIAPSPELREWFGHEPERFAEFSARYADELDHNLAMPDFLKTLQAHPSVILLYAAKNPDINHAVVLRNYLSSKLSK